MTTDDYKQRLLDEAEGRALRAWKNQLFDLGSKTVNGAELEHPRYADLNPEWLKAQFVDGFVQGFVFGFNRRGAKP